MNKSELISALEPKLGSKKAAADAVDAIVDTIIREVAKGGSVGITGFGTFETKEREARVGRNPHTKEAIEIPATRVPAFKASKALKDNVAK